MLQLMFGKHRNKEVGPPSHSVSDKIKLLGLQLSLCLCVSIHTSHCDEVRTSLSLRMIVYCVCNIILRIRIMLLNNDYCVYCTYLDESINKFKERFH